MRKKIIRKAYHYCVPAVLACSSVLLATATLQAQLAAGKPRFLGNVVANSVPSNFSNYWNQVTPENSGKWGSVESSRDNMNWSALTTAYNYAKSRGYPFKQHTFVWGSQEPGWIGSLSQADQRAEVEEWIQQYGQMFPNTDYIDVVNEPLHAPASYRNALGGAGATGWDWVIWSFEKARQYCPNAKLLINDYGIINDGNAVNQYKQIIMLLKDRGLIDGIGIQCHYFNVNTLSTTTIQNNLNSLAQTGLPIYVSELDITGDDNTQLQRYSDKFPVFWNHSAVQGITLWGYVEGQTWVSQSGLLRSNGTERPAMGWLRNFINSSNPPGGGSNTIVVRARGTNGSESISLKVNNSTIATWTLSTAYQDYTASTNNTGGINVEFTNDASGRDVQVDYIQVNESTRQAENQSVNTGVWQNSSCGGSNSEWLHCNGYIGFGNVSGGGSNPIVIRARGTNGSESIQLRVNNNTIATWTLSTGYQDYTATGSDTVTVHFTNDASGRDVQVDYAQIGGTTYQAENQSVNTGVWQNSSCGGSNSEWLHCNGYIQFSTAGGSAARTGLVAAGEEELQPADRTRFYPNPATRGRLTLELAEGMQQVRILDMSGRTVKVFPVNGQRKMNINLGVAPGAYILQLINNKEAVNKKIVVQ